MLIIFIVIIALAMATTSPRYYPLIALFAALAVIIGRNIKEHFDGGPNVDTDAEGGTTVVGVGGMADSDDTQDTDDDGNIIGSDADIANGNLTVDASDPTDRAIIGGIVKTQWDNTDAINQMFAREPETEDGDQRLYDKMKDTAGRNKEATLARTRFTSDNFRPWFQEELDEQEKRVWWEDDGLDNQMVKDGVDYNSY